MLLNLINWREDFESMQDNLSFQYHLHSATTSFSPLLLRSRLKSMKLLFSNIGKDVQMGKHCFSSPSYSLYSQEENILGLGQAALCKFYDVIQNEQDDDYIDFAPYQEEIPLTLQQMDSLDIYYLKIDGNALFAPLFYFNQQNVSLERIKEWDHVDLNQIFPPYIATVLDSKTSISTIGIFVCVINLYRAQKLFGDRGYRLGMLRAGGVAERLKRCALQIPEVKRVHITADFLDREVNRMLDLDGISEAALVCVTLHAEPEELG